MEIVPLSPVPAQIVNALLNNQAVILTLRQLRTGLYMNIVSNGVEIVGLVACQNLNRIVRDLYLGFEGDFVFLDNTGAGNDPNYLGLGSTYSLVYISPSELPPGVG